jgi:pfkB family carbohydrate kinase
VIALVGQSVLDQTFWPDGVVEERLGGAPVFASRAVAARWPAVVITHGGNAALRRPLHGLGPAVVEGPSERTTVFEVTLYGDGTWSECVTALGDPFLPSDVERWMADALAPCSIAVCGTQWRGDFPAETLAVLARRRQIFLDGQGPARAPALGPVRLACQLDHAVLRHVDVLKLDEEEAAFLIGGIDPHAALATGVPVLVVTLGERGAVVLSGGVATEVKVKPVLGLADTVGAGDSFLALMAGATAAGAGPVEAAARACEGVAELLRARLADQHVEFPVRSAAGAGR